MFRPAAKPLPALLTGVLILSMAACESKQIPNPPNLVVAPSKPRAWPAPPVAAPDAKPRIVRVWISSLRIYAGMWLNGEVVTSTNVASLEVRTAAFSINSDHVGPGRFAFHTRVLELPPLARRHRLDLSIIARNAAGRETIEYATVTID